MKVVCFTRNMHFLRYFVNEIHRVHPVSLCVFEETPVPWLWFKKYRNRILRRDHFRDYREYFGAQCEALASDIPVMRTPDINGPEVADMLDELKPDVVLDHGTSIVRDHILDKVPLTLNVHWGLSPYYRGSFCTEWALVNWDPHNIGVTVHKLSAQVDGGDILGQVRVPVESGDTANRINMRLTLAGTSLINRALTDAENGREPVFHRQDMSRGSVRTSGQWSDTLSGRLKEIESGDLFARMNARPSRGPQPIITYDPGA